MSVAFYDPYLAPGMEVALGLRRCGSLEELMATSDIVSVHAPLTEETIGLLGRKAFSAAKPAQILINTARGPIVDLDALRDALRRGRLAAAALDATPQEPPAASHPLIAAYIAREP